MCNDTKPLKVAWSLLLKLPKIISRSFSVIQQVRLSHSSCWFPVRISALTETCLTSKVSTELAHDITVALANELLSDGLVVLLDVDGEGGGATGAGRGEQHQLPGAQGTHKPLGVQRLGVPPNAAQWKQQETFTAELI